MDAGMLLVLFVAGAAYSFGAHIYYLFHRWVCPVKWTVSEQLFGIFAATIWPIAFPFIAAFVVINYDAEAAKRR
jgi:hypothetical protein